MKPCRSPVEIVQDVGVVCCFKLWKFPEARCELCGCSWGSGSIFVRKS